MGASSGGPEKFDISPVGEHVLSLVSTRVMVASRIIPTKFEFQVLTGS